jgi:hypothetical protein
MLVKNAASGAHYLLVLAQCAVAKLKMLTVERP